MNLGIEACALFCVVWHSSQVNQGKRERLSYRQRGAEKAAKNSIATSEIEWTVVVPSLSLSLYSFMKHKVHNSIAFQEWVCLKPLCKLLSISFFSSLPYGHWVYSFIPSSLEGAFTWVSRVFLLCILFCFMLVIAPMVSHEQVALRQEHWVTHTHTHILVITSNSYWNMLGCDCVCCICCLYSFCTSSGTIQVHSLPLSLLGVTVSEETYPTWMNEWVNGRERERRPVSDTIRVE